jgi:hypothetical protein
MKKVLVLCACLLGLGCDTRIKRTLEETTQIDDIVSVYMNSPSEYVVFTKTGQELKPHVLHAAHFHPELRPSEGVVKVFTDVEQGKPVYAVVRYYKLEGCTSYSTETEVDLHIHSEKTIQGGEWSYRTGGKYPQTITGKVNRIE